MSRRSLWNKAWPDHDELTAEVTVTVPFQDADPTGVAWHGNYYRYYDTARVALLDRLEFGYRAMANEGQIWPIVESQVRYVKSVPFGEALRVSAQLVEWAFRLRIHYLLHNSAGERVNEAVTVQVPVAANDESLIVGSPPALIERIETLIGER